MRRRRADGKFGIVERRPKFSILCVRISAEEKRFIEEYALKLHQSVGDIIRTAWRDWYEQINHFDDRQWPWESNWRYFARLKRLKGHEGDEVDEE